MEKYSNVQTPEVESQRSRRTFLRNAAIGTAGATSLVAAGAVFMASQGTEVTHASSANTSHCVTPIADILTIGRTAERLAVTFYSHALKNADDLDLDGSLYKAILAALVEEQIHENYFASAGGKILTSTFSFPHGEDTFHDQELFVKTQQQLEGVFDSAFLSAIREFAQHGRPDLAQLAGQIATIEAEHRALGRLIGGLDPADNWAFSPVFVAKVGDAPDLVAKAGYLSPSKGNSYTYRPVDTNLINVDYRTPFVTPCK